MIDVSFDVARQTKSNTLFSHPVWCQVNADVVDLVQLSNGQLVKIGGSTKSVGRFISTKAVGSDERHDITHQYKYPEGTNTQNMVHFYKHILSVCCRVKNASDTVHI